jgi:Pyridine nucleotide-disulphide oxidoreductase/Protein of unknown function (DUF917)
MTARHRVVIVGGGFGGLAAAKALRRAPVDVTLVDRQAHHLFQPLLYQVATGVLSQGNVAPPLRDVLRHRRNAEVVLADVGGVDVVERRVVECSLLDRTWEVPYDSLIVAAGSAQSYFGHDEFAAHAPGMKTIDDALEVRGRIFGAFELAKLEEDPARRSAWLTFVVVGAGPTGVKMVGQIAELARMRPAVCALGGGPRGLRRASPSVARQLRRRLRGMPAFVIEGTDAYAGASMAISFQNENLIAWVDGTPVVTVPDLICIVNREHGEPVTTELLRYGFRVAVLGSDGPSATHRRGAPKATAPPVSGTRIRSPREAGSRRPPGAPPSSCRDRSSALFGSALTPPLAFARRITVGARAPEETRSTPAPSPWRA